MPSRETIAVNTKRKLWADCAGHCQNPGCNKYLFQDVDDDCVSLANMAHIIGVGTSGPRSEHELAAYVDKNGVDNLIMLCLDCHKIIDELEKKFGVEKLRAWKVEHSKKVNALFSVPWFTSERDLLIEVDRILEENKTIFDTYGPFSDLAMAGSGGDSQKVWKRRCLDTILPNNERIVRLMEKHKNSFGYPWEIYRGFLIFKSTPHRSRKTVSSKKKSTITGLFLQHSPSRSKQLSDCLPRSMPKRRAKESNIAPAKYAN